MYARIHGPDEQNLVFVVHGHDNEKLGLASHEIRSESVPRGLEVIRVASGCRVAHLGELLNVLLANGDDMGRNWYIEHQVALGEEDLLDRATLHELVTSNVPAATACMLGMQLRARWVVVRHSRHRLRGDLGHLVAWVEMDLRASIAARERLCRLCVPV